VKLNRLAVGEQDDNVLATRFAHLSCDGLPDFASDDLTQAAATRAMRQIPNSEELGDYFTHR
jgi:hypothetical protein